MQDYEDDYYEDDCDYDSDYWENEEKRRVLSWQKSKDKMYAVRMNIGGGLWKGPIELRHCEDDDPGEYWCENDNTNYPGDDNGNKVMAFKRKKDAENFLAGAKWFRDFVCVRFFIEKVDD